MDAPLTSWIDEEREFFERWGLRTGPGRTTSPPMVEAIPAALEVWIERLGGTDGCTYVYRTDLRIFARHELAWRDGLLVIAADRDVIWALKEDEATDRVWYDGSEVMAEFHPSRLEQSIAHGSTQEFLTAFDRYACLWDQANLFARRMDRPGLDRLLAAVGAHSSLSWSYPIRGRIHVAPRAIVHAYAAGGVDEWKHRCEGPGELEVVVGVPDSADLVDEDVDAWHWL